MEQPAKPQNKKFENGRGVGPSKNRGAQKGQITLALVSVIAPRARPMLRQYEFGAVCRRKLFRQVSSSGRYFDIQFCTQSTGFFKYRAMYSTGFPSALMRLAVCFRRL